MEKIGFKRLDEKAVAPERAHATDAGFDLVSTRVEEDRIKGIVTYHTGIALEIPDGYVGLLFPRSSVYKVQLSLANCVGVIDSGYRGEVLVKFRIVQPHLRRYGVGDKVAQLVVVKLPEVALEERTELGGSERGEGGFGSTGV